jgi:hypothetical protein
MTTTMLILTLALVAIAFARLSRGILIVVTVAIALAIAAIGGASHQQAYADAALAVGFRIDADIGGPARVVRAGPWPATAAPIVSPHG